MFSKWKALAFSLRFFEFWWVSVVSIFCKLFLCLRLISRDSLSSSLIISFIAISSSTSSFYRSPKSPLFKFTRRICSSYSISLSVLFVSTYSWIFFSRKPDIRSMIMQFFSRKTTTASSLYCWLPITLSIINYRPDSAFEESERER